MDSGIGKILTAVFIAVLVTGGATALLAKLAQDASHPQIVLAGQIFVFVLALLIALLYLF